MKYLLLKTARYPNDARAALIILSMPVSVSLSWAADGRFTLVIDPGHGGHDAGAIGAISKEKDINLNIALSTM